MENKKVYIDKTEEIYNFIYHRHTILLYPKGFGKTMYLNIIRSFY
jgi:predicted ATP-binding protein involved in virulence